MTNLLRGLLKGLVGVFTVIITVFLLSRGPVWATCSIVNPQTVPNNQAFTVTVNSSVTSAPFAQLAVINRGGSSPPPITQNSSSQTINFNVGPLPAGTYDFGFLRFDSQKKIVDQCVSNSPTVVIASIPRRQYFCHYPNTAQASCDENPVGASSGPYGTSQSCSQSCLSAGPGGGSVAPPKDWLKGFDPGNQIPHGLDMAFITGRLIPFLISGLLTVVILSSLLFVVIGGIRWMTSGGDKEGVAKARATVTYALIGLVAALLSFLILALIQCIFTDTSVAGLWGLLGVRVCIQSGPPLPPGIN